MLAAQDGGDGEEDKKVFKTFNIKEGKLVMYNGPLTVNKFELLNKNKTVVKA